jgi:hypothetical protein
LIFLSKIRDENILNTEEEVHNSFKSGDVAGCGSRFLCSWLFGRLRLEDHEFEASLGWAT